VDINSDGIMLTCCESDIRTRELAMKFHSSINFIGAIGIDRSPHIPDADLAERFIITVMSIVCGTKLIAKA
jgi:hypothetical protein